MDADERKTLVQILAHVCEGLRAIAMPINDAMRNDLERRIENDRLIAKTVLEPAERALAHFDKSV